MLNIIKSLYQHRKKVLIIPVLLTASLISGYTAKGKEISQTYVDGAPSFAVDVSRVKDPVPQKLPLSKGGNTTYHVKGHTYHVLKTATGYNKVGVASWYGTKFHGHLTSNGETYNMMQMTAASKELPLPSYVKVTNLNNHRSVIVKVNDRGPFKKGRLIDLSYAAAIKLGVVNHGTAKVRVVALNPGSTVSHSSVARKAENNASDA